MLARMDLAGAAEDMANLVRFDAQGRPVGLDPDDDEDDDDLTWVFDSLRRQNAVAAAGSVETPTDRVFVRVDGPFDTSERVKTVPVQAGGRVFRVGDVAEVRRGYEDPASFTMRYNGRPAVGIGVVMSPGENMLRVGEALDAERRRIEADLPAGALRVNGQAVSAGARAPA